MSRHSITWLAIFVVVALMFLRLPQMVAEQDSVIHTYSALVEVDALAKQNFVEAIDDDRLVDGAIRGMMVQLDPYSGYLAPDQLPAFERRQMGDYTGIGLELGRRNGRLTVVAPIEGSPAARAGIVAGDVIVAVNGLDVDGLSVFDVDELLIGPSGTTVGLAVEHVDEDEAEALTIVRGPVTLRTVRGVRRSLAGEWDYVVDPVYRIGYVRVSGFLDHTIQEFDAALADLLARGARGLVLDLRFNPGGLMHQAIAMADRFLTRGIIVSTVTRRRAVHQYPAVPRALMADQPVVVLINAGSASASEIVTGALQDHGRAIVIGERSFGKGSVQQLIRLTRHNAAIKLTTAYYRLPKGRIIHRTEDNARSDSWGVIPDITIALSEDEHRAVRESRRAVDHGGATLSGQPADGRKRVRTVSDHTSPPPSVLLDRQLNAALDQIRSRLADTSAAPHS